MRVSSSRPAPPPPEPLAPLVDAHTHLDACGAESADDVRAILDRAAAVAVQAGVTIADLVKRGNQIGVPRAGAGQPMYYI